MFAGGNVFAEWWGYNAPPCSNGHCALGHTVGIHAAALAPLAGSNLSRHDQARFEHAKR